MCLVSNVFVEDLDRKNLQIVFWRYFWKFFNNLVNFWAKIPISKTTNPHIFQVIGGVWTGERSENVQVSSIRLLGIGFSFVYNGKVSKWHSCECILVNESRGKGPVMYYVDPRMLCSANALGGLISPLKFIKLLRSKVLVFSPNVYNPTDMA